MIVLLGCGLVWINDDLMINGDFAEIRVFVHVTGQELMWFSLQLLVYWSIVNVMVSFSSVWRMSTNECCDFPGKSLGYRSNIHFRDLFCFNSDSEVFWSIHLTHYFDLTVFSMLYFSILFSTFCLGRQTYSQPWFIHSCGNYIYWNIQFRPYWNLHQVLVANTSLGYLHNYVCNVSYNT